MADPQGRLSLDTSRLHPAYRRPLSGRYFVVLLGEQRWRSRSLWDQQLEVPAQPGVHSALQTGPADQQLLRFRGEYEKEGQPITVVVAQDYTPILHTYNQTRTVVLVVWGGGVAGIGRRPAVVTAPGPGPPSPGTGRN